MRLGLFFDLLEGKHINLTIYWDQVSLESLKDFCEEAFGELESIVLEDNAPPHKKMCIPIHQTLGKMCHQYSSNSPDLNSIENI